MPARARYRRRDAVQFIAEVRSVGPHHRDGANPGDAR